MSEHTYKTTIEVDVEVVLDGIHGYTPATMWQPEEPAGFDGSTVYVYVDGQRIELYEDDPHEDGPLYAELVEKAWIDAGQKAEDEAHERGDYLHEQMKDRRAEE